jgi:hypothetical protein
MDPRLKDFEPEEQNFNPDDAYYRQMFNEPMTRDDEVEHEIRQLPELFKQNKVG